MTCPGATRPRWNARLDDPKDSGPKKPSDAERDAALGAWTRGDLSVDASAHHSAPDGEGVPSPQQLRRMLRDTQSDEDGYVAPPHRPVFPVSFLVVLAVCLGALAVEPTADLSWQLFGPSEAIDLGHPANYSLDSLADGQRVRIEGMASPRRGSYTRWGERWEVFALIGTPLLVRTTPGDAPEPNEAVSVQVEGRLVKLDASSSSFLERLVRPASRYSALKLTFEALGELPPGRTVFLVLDGVVPRSSFLAIAWPFVLWGLCLFAAASAVRATRRRRVPPVRAS